MKRVLDFFINLILPIKRFRANRTCLFDLPNEIILLICRYLTPTNVLYSFYTPEKPQMHLHRLISDYYTKINLGAISYDELNYFINLFTHSDYPLRPKSLTLTNEHVSFLINQFFFSLSQNTIKSIFINLINLTFIDLSTDDLRMIETYYNKLKTLEYLHVTIRKSDKDKDFCYIEEHDRLISHILFNGRMCNLHKITVKTFDGISLYKCLTSHQGLRYVNISLCTIDDLFILLNGLIPNVETLIVQLRQARLLTCRRQKYKPLCSRLIDFTLLENHTGIVVDDIQSSLGYMPNLRKLTLSVRNTPDPIFSHGLIMESMLTKYVPHLQKFDYTMTHQINDKTLIQDFIRYPMNSVFYDDNNNTKYIHIFSVAWPSNQQDKREIPIVNGDYNISVTSDVKSTQYMNDVNITRDHDMLEMNERFRQIRQLRTCLSIDIILPRRISKLILSKETPVGSMINLIPQLSINHLIVKRRLIDEKEIVILAHQFPNVKYLELLFPFKKIRFTRCFKTLFSLDDTTEKRSYWSKMIHFRTIYTYQQSYSLWNNQQLHNWLIRNTDLKFHSIMFYVNCSDSMFSIWL